MHSKSDHRPDRFRRPGIVAFFLAALMASILTAPSSPAWAGGAAVCGNGIVEPGEGCDTGGRCAPVDGSSCTLDSECPAGSECVAIGADGDCCSANCQVEESLACETCDDGLDSDQDGLADRFDPECASLATLYGHALIATDSLDDPRGARFNRSSSVRAVDGTLSPFLSGFPPYPPYAPYPVGPSLAATCLPHAAFEGGASFDGPVSVRGSFTFSRGLSREIGPTSFAGVPANVDPLLFPGSPGFAYPMTPAFDTSRGNNEALIGIGSCSAAGTPCVTRFDCPGATETCTGKVTLSSQAADNLGLVDRIGASEAYADCLAALEELAALPELLRELPRTLELPGLSVASRKNDLVIALADGEDAVISLDSVKLRPSGKLILSGNARSVVIFVSDRLVFARRSNMELAGGLTADRVLWILDGRSLLRIGSSDERTSTPISAFGTFWATTPRFSTTVGSASRVNGALFSDGVRLENDSSLEHVPFSPLLPVDLTVQLEAVPNPPNPELDPDSGIVASGENLLYTVRVSSHGPSVAPAVTVVKTLPDEVAFLAATASQGRCIHDGSVSGGTVSCYLGTLGREDQAPANEATVWIDAQVLDNVEGDLEGNVEVSAGVGELHSDDNEATVVTPAVTLCNILTVPPAPPTFALVTDSGLPGDNRTNVPDVLVEFAACGTWEYQVDGGAWNPGIGETFQLTIGTHSYAARHTDLEGTTSPASTAQVFEYDAESTAISLVLMDSNDQPVPVDPENPAASSATNDPGAYLAIDGIEAGATWSYIVDLEGDWVEGSGATLALEEGLHQYVVRQIDLAGNQSGTGGEFYLDSTGIGPLTVELAEDTGTPGDGITFNPEVLVGGIKTDATWEFRVDTQPLWTRGVDASFDLLPATHTYTVRQIDEAGSAFTADPVEFTYRGEAATPLLRLVVDSGPGEEGILIDGISNQPAVKVHRLEDGATWEYRVDSGAFVAGSGDGFDMIQDGLAHSYFARQTNAAGQASLESAEAVFTFDATAPAGLTLALVTDSATPGDGITNVPEIQVGDLQEGDIFEFRVDDGEWTLRRSDIVPMEVGAHTYQLRRYDVAGNASVVSEATFTYLNADIEAPKLTLANDTGPALGDGFSSDGEIRFVPSGADPNATWEYQIDGGPWLAGSGDSFTALPGSHTYRVRQLDAAGNASPESDPFTFFLSEGVPVFSSPTTAHVADPDSEGLLAIGTDTVLYTAVAVDPDGSDVSFALSASEQFTIDAETGELRFSQPVGFTLAGPNAYTATIVAGNAAGNTASRSVEVRVLRTNTSAPQVDLGEVKTGVQTLGVYNNVALLGDGGVLAGASGTYRRLAPDGQIDPGFATITSATFARVFQDGQGRLYLMSNNGSDTIVTVTRFLADGALDTSYGGGTISVSASPSGDRITLNSTGGAGVRSDGTLYAVGLQSAPGGQSATVDSALLVVAPNGTILTNQRTDFAPGASDVNRLVLPGLDPRHLYVFNTVSTPDFSSTTRRVQRYIDGVLDGGFASGGALALGAFDPRGMWIDRQGRLLILSEFGALTRYSADGVLDAGFVAPTLPVAGSMMVFGPDGGSWYYSSAGQVRRLLPNGSLDSGFAGSGVLALGPKSATNGGLGAEGPFRLDATGEHLIVLGSYFDAELGAAVSTLTRFSTNGVLDNGYGDVALTITEGNRAIAMLTTAASIIDADSAATNYGGVSVTIEREGGADTADLFSARGLLQFDDLGQVVWDGEVVGTYTRANGKLEIVFDESASHPDFDGVLRALTYYNNSQQPESRVRLLWTVNDHDPVGALATSAVQTINIVGDRADVGDPTIEATLNGGAVTLTNYAQVGGRHYYVLDGTNHDTLDNRFNAGQDTTDAARSVTPTDGNTYILLSETELEDLLADPELPASYGTAPLSSGIWTATIGTGPGTHIAMRSGTFQSRNDFSEFAAVVEVLPSPFAPTGPVDPRFVLAEDNGASFSDNLTSNGRLGIVGFEQALSFEFSLDGGATWTMLPAGSELGFVLPAGLHPAGRIKARQVDQSGFETEIANTVTYNIDPTIRSLQLLNDQGTSTSDAMTADGRVLILNFDAAHPWEYSIDDGQNWQGGGPLAGGLGFVLPDGVYESGTVRVRQDVEGFITGTNNSRRIVIDPVTGQGTIRLVADTGSSASDGLTADSRVNVTGLVGGVPWEFSTNGGSSWQAGTAVAGAVQTFELPDGIHAVGNVRARQTDAAGFEAEVANTMAFNVDRTVRSLKLLNDQGTRTADNVTADGRIVAVNFDLMFAYEYSINGGQNWLVGGVLVGGLGGELGFILPAGNYPAGSLRVRQDISGFVTEASSNTRYTIDPVKGQGVLDLATDSGVSASDGLTSEPRVTVTGLVRGLPWEFSTNSGGAWQAGTIIDSAIQSLTLPEGVYGAGAVRVRQTDAAGFELTLLSAAAYTIDRSIGEATISLVNDTGISNTDLTSADGTVRIELTGLSAGDTWAYTTNGGVAWTAGVGASGTDIVLPVGSYTARQVRVRLSDEAGNQFIADFDKAFRIDDSDVTGPVFTSASTAAVLDSDGPGATTIPTSRTLYTPAVTDENLVVFSLSGAGAGDFQIDATSGRLSFASATGFVTGGPNSRSVTIVATDLFGNAGSLEVTVEVVVAPGLVSRSPAHLGSMPTAGSITLVFDQPVQIGRGEISLFDTRSFQEFLIDVTDASQVTVAGNTLTLRPTNPLPDKARIFAYFPPGTVTSLHGFAWAGVAPFSYFFNVTTGVQIRPDGVNGLAGEVKIALAPEDREQLGSTSDVSMAGDVNGDGRDDILVAIPKSDPSGRVDAGRVYLIFGSDSMDEIDLADVAAGTGGFVIDGLAAGDRLGTAAVGVGDFDGDGKSDLALTAPEARGGIGEAYVIYGKTTGTPVDLTSVRAGVGGFAIQGEDAVKNFDKVAAIGDFNGDGKSDIAFASTAAIATVSSVTVEEQVRTWTTTRTWQTVDVQEIRTREPVTVVNPFSVVGFISDPLEFALENVEDLLTDPKEVFAPDVELLERVETRTTTTTWTQTTLHWETTRITHTLTKTSPSAGLVYVLLSGRPAVEYRDLTVGKLARPFSTVGFSISGVEASERLGYTMSPIGDVNNDGYDDFYLAGYVWDGQINNGFVVLGTSYSTPGNRTSQLLGNGDGGYLLADVSGIGAGTDAAPLGDVNGDGFSDFAVGSRDGTILVVHGRLSTNLIQTNDLEAGIGGYPIHADGTDEPTSIEGLGDVNGDGIGDMLASDGFEKAWVIYGRSGNTAVELRDVGNGAGGFRLESNVGFIRGMAGAGDFDGDGLQDYAFLLTDGFGGPPYLWLLPGSTVGVSH